ncbi:class I SAM-dependent methyltransferase [Hymenobacter glacieicola]|uniref:Methyltransferase n=1 Tax=Hymenobacter glacieicola TaxID=1562124 RepID=A0ABQ1WJZ9_9BACT|nr:class I SAM-dependent methyltransferase [Hymenobacter glacieicola]GGG33717.1 methyltransferase [Hymenobacter glacieicola]
MLPFSDPAAVARYAEGPPRLVPGFGDLHRMALLLLAECVPPHGQVLVLGAGGGLELKAFAESQPSWLFTGVDPSAEMLQLARATLGPLLAQVRLHEGYIDTAPAELYDAATCLLTLHFLSPEQRLDTLRQLRQRLKPGAPLVVAHHSFSQQPDQAQRWLARYAAFAVAAGVAPVQAEKAAAAIRARLPVLSPQQDEELLREAGFTDISLFYAGFTFRGWVAYHDGRA